MSDFGPYEARTIEEMQAASYGEALELLKADDPVLTSTASVYNAVFGAKVWVQLNLESNVFGSIPKEPWGRHSGVRVLKTRSYTPTAALPAGPANLQENGTLPDTNKPALDSYTQKPVHAVDTFDVSQIQQFLGHVDDSLGDTLATYREYFGRQHIERINRQLSVRQKDFLSANRYFTSLDQIVSGFPERNAVVTSIPANAEDVFGIDRSAAASVFDAQLDVNVDGTPRPYSNSLLDSLFTNLWTAGARPSVILTGYKTWQKIKADTVGTSVGASYAIRYIDPTTTATVSPGVNGVQPVIAGVAGALQVTTYNGVPIITSKDVKAPVGVSEADPVYVLDYREGHLGFRTAQPTQYYEAGILSGNPFVVNRMGQEGMYATLGETFARWFAVQGKITALSA